MRLQRYLAQAGVASRRASEDLIVAGRVRVDGKVVRELGTTVLEDARVEVDGRAVHAVVDYHYVILNKPLGVVSTMRDPEGRRTVAEVVRAAGVRERIVPVGRLDYDTSGVLLLTDDGTLAHVLAHPRYGVEKTYRALVRGKLDRDDAARLFRGVGIGDAKTAPAKIKVVAARREGTLIDLTIHEGRNRQVRRMLERVGHPVLGLTRLRFGPIALGDLAPGHVRDATPAELASLRAVLARARDAQAAEDAS